MNDFLVFNRSKNQGSKPSVCINLRDIWTKKPNEINNNPRIQRASDINFIFCHFIHLGVAGVYLSIGKRQGKPWTSCQFITGLTCRDEQPSTTTFAPTASLESPINLPFWTVGGNRTQRNSAYFVPSDSDSNPGPSCCEATALTTVPPCPCSNVQQRWTDVQILCNMSVSHYYPFQIWMSY